jgi:hypothetical protein
MVMRVLRLFCALVAAAALLAGCSDDAARPESPSTPAATAPPASAPPSAAPRDPVPASTSVGSEGLTVRYLDADGKIRTLQPKDFPR